MEDHRITSDTSIGLIQRKEEDEGSHCTAAEGTVDMDLSVSMDLSFDLTEHSEEKASSSPNTTSTNSNTVVGAAVVAKNGNSTSNESHQHRETAASYFAANLIDVRDDVNLLGKGEDRDECKSIVIEEAGVVRWEVGVDEDREIGKRPDSTEHEQILGSQSRSDHSEVFEQDDEEVHRLSAGDHTETLGSENTAESSLPGAFKVYSKLVVARQEKNERCDEDPKTGLGAACERHVATESNVETRSLRRPTDLETVESGDTASGGYKPYSRKVTTDDIGHAKSTATARNDAKAETMRNSPLRKHSSKSNTETYSHLADGTVSDQSHVQPQLDLTGRCQNPITSENEVSESDGSSHLASFLEDLSESIDGLTQSPRRTNLRSVSRGSPRETIMHRRVMQKRRRSTPATEPGAIGSRISDRDNGSLQDSDDNNCLFLPSLGQFVESNDGASVSSFTDLNQDTHDLEHGSNWAAITAELVTDTSLKQDERARVIEETTLALTSKAVPAEVVDLDAMIHQKITEGDASKSRRRKLFTLSCAILIGGVIFSIIATILLMDNQGEASQIPFPTEAHTISTVPTGFAEGDRTFQSRDELLSAIDEYVAALNQGTVDNSSVAIRYGYPIGSWDVSKVKDFSRLFDVNRYGDATVVGGFNEDLGNWDVSNAVSMSFMFAGLTSFEGKGLSRWQVGQVKDFSFMFAGASMLNEDLSAWNTSSAKSMMSMFSSGAYHGGVSEWDVSNVETTSSMFRLSTQSGNITVDLNKWNVSNVKDMSQMFFGSTFNGKLDQWDVRNVESMSAMFSQSLFNQDISKWQTQNLKDIRGIFGLGSYQWDLTGWDTSKVTDFSFAFFNSSFDGDISSWNTSNGKDFIAMFSLTDYFDGDLSSWDMQNAENCQGMFARSKSFTGKDLAEWDVSNLKNAYEMFGWATSFQEDISSWNVSVLEDASLMLASATSFNHSLCAWSGRLPPEAKADDMFLNSGCLVKTDQNLQANSTSFCSRCEQL